MHGHHKYFVDPRPPRKSENTVCMYVQEHWFTHPSAARNANSKHRQIYVLLVSQCFLGTKNTFYFWWFQRSDQDTNFLMANNDLPNLDIYCYLYNIKFWTSNIMKNRNQYSVMILNLNQKSVHTFRIGPKTSKVNSWIKKKINPTLPVFSNSVIVLSHTIFLG